jgi:hypothetical protein
VEESPRITLGEVLNDPTLLAGRLPSDIRAVIGEARRAGWSVATLGRGSHVGDGLVLREVREGRFTGRLIQWHPGSGHHGPEPYWKVSTPERGTIRIGPQFPLNQ